MEDLCLTYTVCFVVGICPSSTFSATAAKLSQSIIVFQITPWSTCKENVQKFIIKISLSMKSLRKKYFREKKKSIGRLVKNVQKFIIKVSLQEISSQKNLFLRNLFQTELSLMQN